MSGKPKKLTSKKYGLLTILSDTGERTGQGGVIYLCNCECGEKVKRSIHSLKTSAKRNCLISCGCKQKEFARAQGKKSNVSNNPKQKELAIKSLKQYDGTCIVQLKRKNVNKNSTTGYRGISFAKEKNHKYRVRLTLRRKEYFIGYAETIAEALELREQGEKRLYNPVIEEFEEMTK